MVSEDIQNGINTGIGAVSGFCAYKYLPKYVKRPIGKYLSKTIQNVPKSENDMLWQAANDAYIKSDLSKEINILGKKRSNLFPNPTRKKVEIIHIDTSNKLEIANGILKELRIDKNNPVTDNPIWKFIFGNNKKNFGRSVDAAADGVNAFCVPKLKLVVVNKDKMAFSTFHEIGHAMNRMSRGIKGWLSRSRGSFTLLIPITLISALLTNKSKKPKEEMNTREKTGKFLRDNCGFVAAGLMLPTVLEEGLASINGAKLAKGVLDKKMYKKLNGLNAKAWSSYVLGMAIVGAFVQGGVYLRDKIVDFNPAQKIYI